MMMYVIAILGLPLAAAAAEPVGSAAGNLECWPVDPLVKVCRDAQPQRGEALAEVARGECASFQIVVKCDRAMAGLHATATPLEGAGHTLDPRPPRFAGYVPVDRPTQTPSADQLRKPPADYPDPLLEVESLDVPGGQAQPIWVTIAIPLDTPAGDYKGRLDLAATIDGKPVSANVPLKVRVYDVLAGPSRLWVTDWFAPHALHMEIAPEPDSDEFYTLLGRYARNMAEHRHNVALISPIGLADFSLGSDGALAVDFGRFDRWVSVFKDAGVIGRIEGGHIGGRKGGWESEFVVQVRQVKDGEVVASSAGPASAEADAFYSWFFPALTAHLKEKGWIEIYMQHLADEPIASNKDGYHAMAQLARKYGPELRIIEACHTKELAGSMDIWVPQLNFLHDDYDYYRQRQALGEEVWFYTCVYPQGEYANRFIEQPLIKTRLLHWINFRYGATGYLHWGYNQWTADSPFTHTTRPHGGPPYLPAGDPWIVYPGKDGPLDSIRFEAMRDGIADYELLSLLNERDPQAAASLAKKHILDFDKYATDVDAFRATRRELLEMLSK